MISTPTYNRSFSLPQRLSFGQTSTQNTPRRLPPDAPAVRDLLVGLTGGTIGMTKSGNGPRTISKTPVPEYATTERIFTPFVDSSDIDRTLQRQLLRWVYSYYDLLKEHTPGIVITHGTDTMEETAALLAYQNIPTVIVLTGSYSTAGEKVHENGRKIESDATINLERAIHAAQTIPVPGVYIVIHDQLILASQLHKINNRPWDGATQYQNAQIKVPPNDGNHNYFVSIHDQPFGRFYGNGVLRLNARMLAQQEKLWESRLHNPEQFLRNTPGNIPEPAYVEHVWFSKNTAKNVFDDLETRLRQPGNNHGPNGAILEGDWQSRVSETEKAAIRNEIKTMAKEGHYIISTEQNAALPKGMTVSVLPAIALRAKLAALLGSTNPQNPFQLSALSKNLSGEIRRAKPKPHKLEVPKEFEQRGEIVVVSPSLTPEAISDATRHLMAKRDNNPALQGEEKPILLLMGYGDGHLPIGKTSDCVEILKQYTEGHKNKAETLGELLAKSDMLIAVRKAIDSGIEVRMGSKGEYLAPELGAYDIGAILKFIGVLPTADAQNHGLTTQLYLNLFKPHQAVAPN